jgi:hypothetical protein
LAFVCLLSASFRCVSKSDLVEEETVVQIRGSSFQIDFCILGLNWSWIGLRVSSSQNLGARNLLEESSKCA